MALVNPNIAMSFRQPEIQAPNALAQYAQIQQIMSGQQAQDLARYQLGAAQRAESTQNALSEAYAQSIDPATGKIDYNKLTGLVAARGAGAQLPAIQKTRSEAETAQLAADKTKLEIQAAKRKFGDELRRGLSANPSDANIIAFGEDAVLQGLYTPEQVKTTVSQLLALSPADRVRVLAQSGASAGELKPTTSVGPTGIVQIPAFSDKATVVQGTGAAFQMTPAQIAQNEIAQKQLRVSQGNLGVAQARLAWEKSNPGYELQQTEDGSFVGINKRTLQATPVTMGGTVSGEPGAPVKGAPKSKDISVSEQQASYNIARVLNAADEIGKITKKDPKALAPGGTEASLKSVGLEGAANVARSTNRQIVNGAQRDALDALLYLATGAAYNKEQLQGAFEAYIPSYTDDKGTREAKQARMTNLIKDAKVRAGKAWTPKMDAAMSSLTGSSEPAAAADIPAPKGVDASLWNVMTPEERKLWAK
jgi:hypothetical protein